MAALEELLVVLLETPVVVTSEEMGTSFSTCFVDFTLLFRTDSGAFVLREDATFLSVLRSDFLPTTVCSSFEASRSNTRLRFFGRALGFSTMISSSSSSFFPTCSSSSFSCSESDDSCFAFRLPVAVDRREDRDGVEETRAFGRLTPLDDDEEDVATLVRIVAVSPPALLAAFLALRA